MSYWLGIDVGSTFIVAAICREEAGRRALPEVVPLGGRSAFISSVVHLGPDGQVVVGEAAERRAVTDPDRVVREFQRHIGDEVPMVIGGVSHSASRSRIRPTGPHTRSRPWQMRRVRLICRRSCSALSRRRQQPATRSSSGSTPAAPSRSMTSVATPLMRLWCVRPIPGRAPGLVSQKGSHDWAARTSTTPCSDTSSPQSPPWANRNRMPPPRSRRPLGACAASRCVGGSAPTPKKPSRPPPR